MVPKIFAFYVTEFPSGGTGTAVLHTANELIRSGHKVIIYTARHKLNSYPLGIVPLFEVVKVPTIEPDTDENLDFMCTHINNHSVASLVIVAMHFRRLDEVKKRTSCKIVYALHGCPFYEQHDYALKKRRDAYLPGRWGLLLSYWLIQRWRIKWLHSGLKKILPLYRSTLASTDRYVVLCEEYVTMILDAIKPSDNDIQKLRVIKNGIILPQEINRQKEKIILYVGRLTHEDKRPMRLVSIWSKIYKKLHDWRFVIVGDGPELTRLQVQVAKHGIERMEFAGFSNDTELFYQRASIICLTSEYEGWALCLAEGQAYGVVPIAFNCTPGIRDIISQPWKDGVLATPFSCSDFAKKLLRLASNEKLLSEMSAYVIEKSKNYSMQRNSQGYLKLLEELTIQEK